MKGADPRTDGLNHGQSVTASSGLLTSRVTRDSTTPRFMPPTMPRISPTMAVLAGDPVSAMHIGVHCAWSSWHTPGLGSARNRVDHHRNSGATDPPPRPDGCRLGVNNATDSTPAAMHRHHQRRSWVNGLSDLLGDQRLMQVLRKRPPLSHHHQPVPVQSARAKISTPKVERQRMTLRPPHRAPTRPAATASTPSHCNARTATPGLPNARVNDIDIVVPHR